MGIAWGAQTDSRGEVVGLVKPILDETNGLSPLEDAFSAFIPADRVRFLWLEGSAPTALFGARAGEGSVTSGFSRFKASGLLTLLSLGLPIGWDLEAWGSGKMRGI